MASLRKIKLLAAAAGVGLLCSSMLQAGEAPDRSEIHEKLQEHLPDAPIEKEHIEPGPIAGMWTVTIGADVIYVDGSGEYVFQGEVLHLPSRSNVSETHRASARIRAIDQVGEDRMLIYEAPEETRKVTVFTDIDCGYCRQLHGDMEALNEKGLTVRYLFYPRGGEDSDAWNKSDAVWCAEDRHAAIDKAKEGGDPGEADCDDTPTESHFRLGQQVGVEGTPTIITESGHRIGGYLPADRLMERIRELEGD